MGWEKEELCEGGIGEGWDARMTGVGMAGCEGDGLWGVWEGKGVY